MKSLLLLHGAIGSEAQLTSLKNALSKYYKVHTFNFSGHGGKDFSDDFSIEGFANEVLNWMKEKKFTHTSIFGYSMGGYVALYLAKHHPNAIESVVTLATKLYWDEHIATKEAANMQPEIIKVKVPAFAKELSQRHHSNNWELLLEKTATLLHHLGISVPLKIQDFKQVNCPVLLTLGDRDKMVSLVETVSVYKEIPNGQMAILPFTHHAIETVDVNLLSLLIRNFIK